jgi:hypothetical protein
VSGGAGDVAARNAELLGQALKTSVMTVRNVNAAQYTAVRRGWWGSPNNQCVGRITGDGRTSATETQHRQRSGPEYFVNTTISWAFSNTFVEKGKLPKAGKNGNGLLYAYDNFVKPMIELYKMRTKVLENNKVDKSVVSEEGRFCTPGHRPHLSHPGSGIADPTASLSRGP